MFSTNLEFNGNAKAAMAFYADVFGYELKENDIWFGEDGKVAHGEFKIYNTMLMFSDGANEVKYKGFTFAINLTDETELRARYDKMNQAAEVIIPLGKVEFSECYGVLKDQFGIHWQFCLDIRLA